MTVQTIQKYETDSFWKKLVISKTFWILFLVFSFGYPLLRSLTREIPNTIPVLFKLPDFKLTNQNGKPFGTKELDGKVYIASFMFTSCPTVCPGLMEKVKKIQTRMRGVGDAALIVSFTVDPDTDDSKVLNRYSKELGSNPRIWTFLTGDEKDLRTIIVGGFKTAMGEKEEVDGFKVGNTDPRDIEEVSLFDIAHSGKLVLVDQKGQIRGYYDTDKVAIDRLMIDVGLLINNVPLKDGV